MKIRTIEARKSFTVNLGNFESLRLEASATADLGAGEDPVVAIDGLLDWVENALWAQVEKAGDAIPKGSVFCQETEQKPVTKKVKR